MTRWTKARAILVACSALASSAAVAKTAEKSPPNIVFIMADDMGYADLSVTGAQGYKTPAIDKLAAQGVRLDQAYANSAVCSPTRTALLTGRYQYRFAAGLSEPNVRFPPGQELPAETLTIATMLKAKGYQTALVGKWHVTKIPEFSPLRYGYDSYFGFVGGAADYFRHGHIVGKDDGAGLHANDKPVKREGYLTDLLADEAVRVIEAKGAKPLFLSLHFNAPHWPWEGPDDGAHAAQLTEMRDPYGGSLDTYAKMMVSLDQNIGKVLAALDAKGLAKNTIVVFTSDNGAERFSNTWPFVGYKGELLEGGIRVPMIVRWPARIKPGTVSHQVAISMDTVPTFLAAAGANPPAETDGVNLLPQLTGAKLLPRILFWRYNAAQQAAVREGDMKYLRTGNKEGLYDVAHDPRERNDLKEVNPELFAALKARWQQWNSGMLPYPANSSSEGTMRFYVDRYAPADAQRGQDGPQSSKEQTDAR